MRQFCWARGLAAVVALGQRRVVDVFRLARPLGALLVATLLELRLALLLRLAFALLGIGHADHVPGPVYPESHPRAWRNWQTRQV